MFRSAQHDKETSGACVKRGVFLCRVAAPVASPWQTERLPSKEGAN